ncbi:MAG: endonuclease/exonuclease/phosphatase family protein [Tannerellaceae bacterium]|jgi:endonuclease/exonuclease/phosphatase family metal-dependent hydrolase|nr:endonuclease/exonuclease/phosphatase family protein [Tannerellaceae bacterium]
MKKIIGGCILLMLLPIVAVSQEKRLQGMWYNMENLFGEGELTEMKWTPKKYAKKLQKMGQLLLMINEWQETGLIGLCEIGGANVMEDLLHEISLKEKGYRYSMTEGADVRGIQVALLYKVPMFTKMGEASYRIDMEDKRPTRDILHVWGQVCTGDTLDVLLCHFPSRSGEAREVEWRQHRAGRRLREVCDSLQAIRGEKNKVLVMGDFNEGKELHVLRNEVGATSWKKDVAPTDKGKLYELPYSGGSYKYRGVWSTFDKILVNGGLLDSGGSVYLKAESVKRMDEEFLLKKDKTWGGVRPWRTHYGYRYEGGFSDHLPLLFELQLNCSPDEADERQRRPATFRFPEGL